MFNFFSKKQVSKTDLPLVEAETYGDFSKDDWEIINEIRPFTMTSLERIKVLLDAVGYITNNSIEGDMVECGTWKGGSIMAMMKKLLQQSVTDRRIWVFDTFDGMPAPKEIDETYRRESAKRILDTSSKETSFVWAYSPIEEARKNILSVGYPARNISFVKGKVEDTIPVTSIEKIALLRLDTDWYSSTKVELEYLFPRLVEGGILIIDDYGHWQGCKKAVDEYFTKIAYPIFLGRVDYTGRIMVKK
jgi:hypothetical protein